METDAPSTSGQSRDVAAMGSAVEIEDETVVALRAALGRTIDSHEVEAFLRAVGYGPDCRDDDLRWAIECENLGTVPNIGIAEQEFCLLYSLHGRNVFVDYVRVLGPKDIEPN